MKNIGIVCEGPTDYVILKAVIDLITGEHNDYVQLQPEPDLTGRYGNGWKGVWKWCCDNAKIRRQLMRNIDPALDFLVIQMDGDVSRKEKSVHCQCPSVSCTHKGLRNPLECDTQQFVREICPIHLPCPSHSASVSGYMEHLENLLAMWLRETDDTCIVIPCDSTEAWIVAAYDHLAGIESVKNPWDNIIAKKKSYHDIRISGGKKHIRIFELFASVVCENWQQVTKLCQSAKKFEKNILALTSPAAPEAPSEASS